MNYYHVIVERTFRDYDKIYIDYICIKIDFFKLIIIMYHMFQRVFSK